MDRFQSECPGEIEPDEDTEEQKIIQDKGIEHERAFLHSLAAEGRGVCDLSACRDDPAPTLAAMRRGEEVIYQGYLVNDDFAGYPDFLMRVDAPSGLGAWRYEPWDTKLARHAQAYFLVQLCCYAEMLEAVQRIRPGSLRIVLGSGTAASAPAGFRTDDFFYYYRAVKEAFLQQQRRFDRGRQPDIPPLADLGRWSGYAERQLEARDDLALIADIRTIQIHKLQAAGLTTLAQVSGANGTHVPRLNDATFTKLQRQARLQIASRGQTTPAYEILAPDQAEGPRGLQLLPASSRGDGFFDMEGFPLIDDAGRMISCAARFSWTCTGSCARPWPWASHPTR